MSQTVAGYPEPGEMFGPYRVVRRLGFGGMGVVFEAIDGTLNRPVALKVISSHLADAHAAGLVHRDIKPANVLLRRREHGVQAYLADFGIARQVGAEPGLTMVGSTVGTPSYMAPELHTGGQAGVESDIYSLGCLLWAAITGTAPYSGTSDYQIVSAHLEQPVPQLRTGSPAADAVNQVLLRSLAKRPTERYVGAAAMSRDLRAAATVAERSGEPAVPATVSRADGRGRRIGLVVGAVALVLTAGVGAAVALAAGDSPSGAPGGAETTEAGPTREKAVASLAATLAAQGGMVTDDIATCVAEGWIDGVGLDVMVEAGFFDEDLNYTDQPMDAPEPEMRDVVTSAITDCTLANLDVTP